MSGVAASNGADRARDAQRLHKLLHLANNAGTEGEAMAAATAAAKLMASRGLTEQDAETVSRNPGRASIEAVEILCFGRRTPPWLELLSGGICRLSGCFAWVTGTRQLDAGKQRAYSTFTLRAAGRPEDLAIARALVPSFAQVVREIGVRRHRRRQGRSAYRLGLAVGLLDRMESVQNDVLERVRRSSRGALEPIDRVSQARAAIGLDGLKEARPVSASDGTAVASGMRDAKNIKLPGQHHALHGQLALKEAT